MLCNVYLYNFNFFRDYYVILSVSRKIHRVRLENKFHSGRCKFKCAIILMYLNGMLFL